MTVDNQTACETFTWTAGDGNTYTTSGVHDHITVGANGCNDTLRLNLTINHGTMTVDNQTACETFTWTAGDGNTYTTSGVHDHITVGANGCNDTLRLNLTITNGTLTVDNQTACETFTWTAGDGNTYTTSGVHDHITVGANGCNDTLRLNLTINHGTMTVDNQTACETYTWPINGQTYTTSGVYLNII